STDARSSVPSASVSLRSTAVSGTCLTNTTMFMGCTDLLGLVGGTGGCPPKSAELLAYSLPNREAPSGTGSASAMLLAGRLVGVIAGGYPVTAVSCHGQVRYAVSNPSGVFCITRVLQRSKVPATVTSALRVAGG